MEADGMVWNKALTLEERARLLGPVLPAGSGAENGGAVAWRQDMMVDEATFAERLSHLGVTPERFDAVLLAEPERLPPPPSAAWTRILQEVIDTDVDPAAFHAALEARAEGSPKMPFYSFLIRFIEHGMGRLRAEVDSLEARHGGPLPIQPGVYQSFANALGGRLLNFSLRTLTLELNVARVLDELPGETSAERFEHFAYHRFLDRSRFEALLGEYPALARLLATVEEYWLESAMLFLDRFLTDRALITDRFFESKDPGALAGIETGVSDSHCRGKAVVHLRFEGGGRLVYKPKPLAVDALFQDFTAWFNGLGPRYTHRTVPVEDRGEYGWIGFVEARPCASAEQLAPFYWRQGSNLALMYLLNATDFHHENLIASGEHPVLIDLEALFQHHFRHPIGTSATDVARDRLMRSVLRPGILPIKVLGAAGEQGVDMSGIGGGEGQEWPFDLPKVEEEGSDTMRFGLGRIALSASNNQPRLPDGLPADPADYVESLVAGFEQTYDLLLERREDVRARLERFAGVEVRHIVRSTMDYARFLQESTHPDYLRDAMDRDRLLDKLWAHTRVRPAVARVAASEQRDLVNGDIPYFSSQPGSDVLVDSEGREIPGALEEASLDEVLRRIDAMSSAHRDAEVETIRRAMVTRAPVEHGEPLGGPVPTPVLALPSDDPGRAPRLLAAAEAVAERLLSQAIYGDTDVTWIGINPADAQQSDWVLSPQSYDLYNGVGGVGLFFAYAATVTGRADFEAVARRALEQVRRRVDGVAADAPADVGAFTGLGSALYVMDHLAALWDEPGLIDEAEALLPVLTAWVRQDGYADVMSGSAGCARVLLNLHERTGRPSFLDAAAVCGDRLAETASPMACGGVAWASEAIGTALTGFSHGTAGIAWVLLGLARALGNDHYRALARGALAYERGFFREDVGNWVDLRKLEGDQAAATAGFNAWCHGAPGIVLGRLLSLPYDDEPAVREEIRIGAATTERVGFGGSHCLCHGDLGNAEVLFQAGRALGEKAWAGRARRVADGVARQVLAGEWKCGLKNHVETPGLLIGTAGIGYSLLRFARPETVPSVLGLAAPPARPHRGTPGLSATANE